MSNSNNTFMPFLCQCIGEIVHMKSAVAPEIII